MSFLYAAERIAAIDRSDVVLDVQQCLHSRDQFSDCQACFGVCPVDAIQPGKPPVFDAQICQTCLACLPACPVGAFTADDAVQSLLTCAARLETKSVELVCSLNENSESGISSESTGILVPGCLAGLGVGAYLALIALGLKEIILRLDACPNCPWEPLQQIVQTQAEGANQLLAHWSKNQALVCATQLEGPVAQRPLWNAENPPLSRRDLFRMAAHQGQIAVARAMSVNQSSGHCQPNRDRLRLISALDRLHQPQEHSELSIENGSFAVLSVSDKCNACATCTRACPTSALTFRLNEDETYYWLKFDPRLCIDCGICARVCAPNAIESNSMPTINQVFGNTEPTIISEGELLRCDKCETMFAARSGQKLCSPCQFRRNNPFGSFVPAGIKAVSKLSGD